MQGFEIRVLERVGVCRWDLVVFQAVVEEGAVHDSWGRSYGSSELLGADESGRAEQGYVGGILRDKDPQVTQFYLHLYVSMAAVYVFTAHALAWRRTYHIL